ncbi:N-acetylglucosamine-6-phosphate deacetylase [Utexia brackfieldae]|uniref:N-acetylglucosamine-6-phosphate deacetylase n=1 Tax=Utexia brackfieldae TaxID=3074108 RepID=UPI00370D927D
MYALKNAQIYTGKDVLQQHAIIIDDQHIVDICADHHIADNITTYDLQGNLIAAGFIDLQLNGCGGVQFNESLDALSVETLETMQQINLQSGCTSFLPTLITSADALIFKAVETMRQYLSKHTNQALGLHLEGPFINPEKKGIHNASHVRQPTAEMIDFLCHNADVIKVITLAPECVNSAYIQQLAAAGIHVAIGHSNATYQTCRQSFDDGITLATHLFNAMSPISGRAPSVVGAIYDTPAVYSTIIADGLHVDWANIRNSYRIKQDKLILVTDAILLAASTLTSAIFAGKTIYNQAGKCVDEAGTLGGSSLTMMQAVANIVHHTDIPLAEALRMASLYPARAIGLDHQLGSIEKGKIANLVVFDRHFVTYQTIINGKLNR